MSLPRFSQVATVSCFQFPPKATQAMHQGAIISQLSRNARHGFNWRATLKLQENKTMLSTMTSSQVATLLLNY